MPTYYIMNLDQEMAQTVAAAMPSHARIAAGRWLTEEELALYAAEYTRTGFQGGLNSYRVAEDARYAGELEPFSGRAIEVPALYIGGKQEWAVYQSPGAFQAMRSACRELLGVHLIEGAGHSIAEERPEEVNKLLIAFTRRLNRA